MIQPRRKMIQSQRKILAAENKDSIAEKEDLVMKKMESVSKKKILSMKIRMPKKLNRRQRKRFDLLRKKDLIKELNWR